jgi:hypothetical protein
MSTNDLKNEWREVYTLTLTLTVGGYMPLHAGSCVYRHMRNRHTQVTRWFSLHLTTASCCPRRR